MKHNRWPMRIGIGYDVHKLVPGRPLVLGGVTIPSAVGLLGHSDADVLTHAIVDALLGAAGWGDIGGAFPDTDPAFQDASSLGLLRDVVGRLMDAGWTVGNVDATVAAEKPRLAPYVSEMAARLARALGTEEGGVNVKATTSEGLGFVGAGDGMAAHAVALLFRSGEEG